MVTRKVVNFDFFKLSFDKSKAKNLSALLLAYKKPYKKIDRENGPISVYGDNFKIEKDIILGTVCHAQMIDIPPKIDTTTNKLEQLPLDPSQGLGYATSFLYDTKTSIIAIESNKNGVSLSGLLELIEFNLKCDVIRSEIVLDPADFEKLNKWDQITKLVYRIARVENGEIFKSQKRAVGEAISIADSTGAIVIETVQSVGKMRSATLAKQTVLQLVRDLLPFRDNKEVTKLEVTGRGENENLRPIDFIKNRIRLKITIEKTRHSAGFSTAFKYYEMQQEYAKLRPALLRAYKL